MAVNLPFMLLAPLSTAYAPHSFSVRWATAGGFMSNLFNPATTVHQGNPLTDRLARHRWSRLVAVKSEKDKSAARAWIIEIALGVIAGRSHPKSNRDFPIGAYRHYTLATKSCRASAASFAGG
jgi:hypothetical protein